MNNSLSVTFLSLFLCTLQVITPHNHTRYLWMIRDTLHHAPSDHCSTHLVIPVYTLRSRPLVIPDCITYTRARCTHQVIMIWYVTLPINYRWQHHVPYGIRSICAHHMVIHSKYFLIPWLHSDCMYTLDVNQRTRIMPACYTSLIDQSYWPGRDSSRNPLWLMYTP